MEQVSNLVLGKANESEKFILTFLGFSVKLGIKPLSLRKLIKISEHISKIGDIKDNDQTTFHVLMEDSKNLKHICCAITIAIDFPIKLFVYNALIRLPLKDIKILFDILIKQSDPTFFLNILASARNLDVLRPKEKVE